LGVSPSVAGCISLVSIFCGLELFCWSLLLSSEAMNDATNEPEGMASGEGVFMG
jgi:hypothetical protein